MIQMIGSHPPQLSSALTFLNPSFTAQANGGEVTGWLSKWPPPVHQRVYAHYLKCGLLCATAGKVRTSLLPFRSGHSLTSLGPGTCSLKGGHLRDVNKMEGQGWSVVSPPIVGERIIL